MSRRDFLKATGTAPMALAVSGSGGRPSRIAAASCNASPYDRVRASVPDPQPVTFSVQYPGKAPIKLAGHFWSNPALLANGRRCPAIVECNPYRRRDGTIIADSKMHPWFAYNGYLCFRVDLQGSGDSEGVLTDEYTDEELLYCKQVIEQIAAHPSCDGNVGMMGKSWSAINSLMVAARGDCPAALKAIVFCCGSDDRFNDDVHYMGGTMMVDNVSWPSSMWGWLATPPDPVIVGDSWKAMWRQRIAHADFWFGTWAAHQTRDAYWSSTSVRDRYGDVKVPVFVISGWQDGYKNPVERIVTGLAGAGTPVAGLLGPWGHKYPFSGYPGPRLDWLRYVVTHWWDRWLKGKSPVAEKEWPELTVRVGESREPEPSACEDEAGKWVAEDGAWRKRTREKVFYLKARHELGPTPGDATYVSTPATVVSRTMLETSSWGECDNDDLPGDQATSDRASLCFDTEPLPTDLDCFGYPTVVLNVACSEPVASVAVRLCEISPRTQASHLVSYRFWNLCDRAGDAARPERLAPRATFTVRIPLALIGHTFKKGWRIRLAISPSFFPTMWQQPATSTVTLRAGRVDGLPESALVLPARPPRAADQRLRAVLPAPCEPNYVNPEDYVPMLAEARPARSWRTVESVTIDGKPGVLVRKTFDSGRYQYGGPLDGLWVDQVAEENVRMILDDPLSLTSFTSSTSILERPHAGWRTRAETTTRIWSEQTGNGTCAFRYTASVRTFIGGERGGDRPFERKTVDGTIARSWI